MKITHIICLVLVICLMSMFLYACSSSKSEDSPKLYCDKCKKNVSFKTEFYGYKYENQGNRLYKCYCSVCGTYLGIYEEARVPKAS